MTAFTLDLPDELAERLAELPKAELNAYAVSVFTPLVQTDEDDLDLELDADTIAAIQEGLDDVEAGRTISLEEAQAHFEAAFAARQQAREAAKVPVHG